MKLAHIRALVADDDPISRGIVSEQLKRLRVGAVSTAESGRTALQQLQDDPTINLLVTDLKMPDMDGIALLRALDTSLQRSVGVIVMSALGEKILNAAQIIALGHKLDVLGAMAKPVALERLREMLDKMPAHNSNDPRPMPSAPDAPDPAVIAEAMNNQGHYIVAQPEVDACSGRFVGVEILSRWNHEKLAGYNPGAIILAAEQTELIHDLTRHIVKKAGEAWKIWRDAGLDLTVSINLSHHNLGDPDFPDWIDQEITRQGLSTDNIILEITETAVPTQDTTDLEVAHRLGLQGFMLAIDDYGTGHANLQQLQAMPFSQLKIDKSFVDGVEHSFESRTIIESSLHMARSLGLKTVAEGVERQSQRELLCQMGCDLMQGYLFARPLPVDQLVSWARHYTPRALATSTSPPS